MSAADDAAASAAAPAGAGAAQFVGRFTQYNVQHDKKQILKDRRGDPLIKKGDAAVKKARKLWNRGAFNPALKIALPGMPVGMLAPSGTDVTAYSADDGKFVFGKLHRIVATRDAGCADFVVVVDAQKVFASPFELVRGGHQAV